MDEAVQEGRRKLDSERRSLVFGTPVLYMHSAEGLVLAPAKPGEGAETADDQAGKQAGAKQGQVPQPSADQVPAADIGLVKRVIQVGVKAAKDKLHGPTQTITLARIAKIESQLTGKSTLDILNQLVAIWDKEGNKEIQEIWFSMMSEAAPDA